MTLTRLALSALVLSLAAAAIAPSASAECVGTITSPHGGRVCTDHPVDARNTCEAVVEANVNGLPVRAFACTDYFTGTDECTAVAYATAHGITAPFWACYGYFDGTHTCPLLLRAPLLSVSPLPCS